MRLILALVMSLCATEIIVFLPGFNKPSENSVFLSEYLYGKHTLLVASSQTELQNFVKMYPNDVVLAPLYSVVGNYKRYQVTSVRPVLLNADNSFVPPIKVGVLNTSGRKYFQEKMDSWFNINYPLFFIDGQNKYPAFSLVQSTADLGVLVKNGYIGSVVVYEHELVLLYRKSGRKMFELRSGLQIPGLVLYVPASKISSIQSLINQLSQAPFQANYQGNTNIKEIPQ